MFVAFGCLICFAMSVFFAFTLRNSESVFKYMIWMLSKTCALNL